MSNRSQGMHAIVSQSVEHRQELCMCTVVVSHLYSKPAFFKSCALTHPKKVECILDTKATSQKGINKHQSCRRLDRGLDVRVCKVNLNVNPPNVFAKVSVLLFCL